MILGIVGHEAAKFTRYTEAECKTDIWRAIKSLRPHTVVSGACHLGGVDIWAIEIAKELNLGWVEFPPARRSWSGGYKERNMQIAEAADHVLCFVVDEYPEEYKGMRFDYCYHCGTKDHIKSGGCWTVKYAKSIGKQGRVVVV